MILPVWDSNPQTCGVDPLVTFGATMTYLQFLKQNHTSLKIVKSFSV